MKYVYSFKEGNKDMRNILGGKGANLCEMAKIGLPVPNGFIVSTDACNNYYENNKELNDEIIKEINEKLEELEKSSGKKLGDKKNPLLVSVRSGARASMPGMMDTILNLGLNDEIVESFSEENKRFIYDSYRRFIQMFSDVVKGYDKSKFERVLDEIKKEKGIKLDIEFTKEDMKEIVLKFKDIYKEISGEEFPQDTKYQLIEAIKSVFNSWNNERANIYRQMNNIPYSWGTAVNVQQMVYGNLNEKSGSGVAFSRNPATGENELFGEYLINAQGEDIVAGIRTPNPIKTLEKYNKDLYEEFYGYAKKLEENNMYTMGDVALMSIQNENLLYKLFGVNAELLIDHAWGYETTTIKDIKEYKPENNSISSGQVLHCSYDYKKARLIVAEMIDSLALELTEKEKMTNSIVLMIGYEIDNTFSYDGDIVTDYYGRRVPKPAHGHKTLDYSTSSSKILLNKGLELYDEIINKNLLVRRINICACNVIDEKAAKKEVNFSQLDLFSDNNKVLEEKKEDKIKQNDEIKLQKTVTRLKNKYGKNIILKAMSLEEGATMKERNMQVGGHKG